MAGKRLSDTASLTNSPAEAGESHHISTRKIDNGYIVNQSTCNPRTGEYRSSEAFMATPPRVIPGRVARGPAPDSSESLREARDYLGDHK